MIVIENDPGHANSPSYGADATTPLISRSNVGALTTANFFSYDHPINVTGKNLQNQSTSRFQTHLPKNDAAQKAHRVSHYLLYTS